MLSNKRIPWNKGLKTGKLSETHRKNISDANKGKTPKNFKMMQKLGWKASKGRPPWNKGKEGLCGENSPHWKGDKAGYHAIHKWIIKIKPKPKFCEKCKKVPPKELANISGKYKRDVNDFEWMCVKCHRKFDGWYEKVLNKVTRGKDGKFYKK